VKVRETVHPFDRQEDLDGRRPHSSARPKAFRFLPLAPLKFGLPTALEATLAYFRDSSTTLRQLG
jgi:hypothetical protein